jgi:hypothetical protein
MRTLGISAAIGLGALMLTLVGGAPPALAAPPESRLIHESMVITAIDRTKRTATLQTSDGETQTIDVPPEIKSYDTMKVGDHVDVDYYESVAMSLLPPGTKPTMTESSSMNRTAPGQGTATHEQTVSATVIAVDLRNNKVTFRGPRGNTQTVSVSDPEMQKRLPGLKPGQVVQIRYTEALAASLRPTSPASSKMQP